MIAPKHNIAVSFRQGGCGKLFRTATEEVAEAAGRLCSNLAIHRWRVL